MSLDPRGKMLKRIISLLLVSVIFLTACSGGKDDPAPPPETEPTPEEEVIKMAADMTSYRQRFIDDIVREVSSDDLVRDKSYVVDDAKVENIIGLLDFALNSTELKSMLDLDISGLLTSLPEKLYSDSIINFAVGYLYPLVEKEFAKVWAGLDHEMTLKDVATGVPVASKAQVTAELHYSDLEDAMEAIKFYLFPTKLADHLPPGYEAAAEKLRLATTKSVYNKETEVMTTPWEDKAILNEEGKLDIPWGVTDRESFLNAFDAAMIGVEPLLMALLANKYCENRGHIGTGDGTAAVLGGKIKLKLNITTIELVLTASANPGYNNTVAPIFEALGLTVPDGNTFVDIRDLLQRGVFEPLDTLIAMVGAAPVSVLLSFLPNIAFAIEAGLIKPLLSMLQTDIDYFADATYNVEAVGMSVIKDSVLEKAYTTDDPIHIDVGEMIDLDSLGVDLSSLNGLLAMLKEPLGFALPAIDGVTLATLGSLTWRDTVRSDYTYIGAPEGKAAFLQANRADVLLFLLRYVFNGLKDRALLDAILAKLGGELPDLVYTIIDRVLANSDNAIAALVELIIPQDYTEPVGVAWRDGGTPKNKAYALYNDFWTTEKAVYMVDNLPSLLNSVLKMAEPDIAGITASNVPALIDGVTQLVCKAELLNNLAGKINELLGGVDLPDAIKTLLKDKLGVDLGYWAGYRAAFADGDRESFKRALVDLLYPVRSIVDFLLTDKDVTIKLTGAAGDERSFITLHGFDAYSTAIIPLLEALGGTPTPLSGISAGTDALAYTLDSIFGILDAIKADPYHRLVVLIPNVLTFLQYGGLTGVVDNLLYSVNLALDTVRPIYDLNIYSLVDFDLRFEKTDPITLACGYLKNLLTEKIGVSPDLNFTTQTLFDALTTGTVESFTSVNGRQSYRVNEASVIKIDMLTVVYDYLLKELLFSANTPAYLNFLKSQFDLGAVYDYIEKILPVLSNSEQTYPGSGKALIFWVFFAAETVVGAMEESGTSFDDLDATAIITALMTNGSPEKTSFATSELRKDIFKPGFSATLGSILHAMFA